MRPAKARGRTKSSSAHCASVRTRRRTARSSGPIWHGSNQTYLSKNPIGVVAGDGGIDVSAVEKTVRLARQRPTRLVPRTVEHPRQWRGVKTGRGTPLAGREAASLRASVGRETEAVLLSRKTKIPPAQSRERDFHVAGSLPAARLLAALCRLLGLLLGNLLFSLGHVHSPPPVGRRGLQCSRARRIVRMFHP